GPVAVRCVWLTAVLNERLGAGPHVRPPGGSRRSASYRFASTLTSGAAHASRWLDAASDLQLHVSSILPAP
ncbi:MAG: hypothetical protein ACKO38_01840, partial [Planctomycetota bacterium]